MQSLVINAGYQKYSNYKIGKEKDKKGKRIKGKDKNNNELLGEIRTSLNMLKLVLQLPFINFLHGTLHPVSMSLHTDAKIPLGDETVTET